MYRELIYILDILCKLWGDTTSISNFTKKNGLGVIQMENDIKCNPWLYTFITTIQ